MRILVIVPYQPNAPMRLAIFILSVVVLLLAACSSTHMAGRPHSQVPFDDWPITWGEFERDTRCGKLGGRFQSIGRVVYVFVPPTVYKRDRLDVLDTFLRPNPRPAWSLFTVEHINDRLIAIADNSSTDIGRFDLAGTCENGWFTVRQPMAGGFSDGAFREDGGVYYIGRSSKGALVVRVAHLHQSSSFWGAFRTKLEFIYWVKFDPQ